MRLFLIIFALVFMFSLPALVCAGDFEDQLSGKNLADTLRQAGGWAWAVGGGLIVADLLLPVPATAVMAALGLIYGPVIGGLIGAAASFAAGLIAYSTARLIGRRAAVFLAGERDLARAESFFLRAGGYAVAFTRPLPVLPEVVAVLAGLTRMNPALFLLSLACGSLPTGLIFGGIGSLAQTHAGWALLLALVVPLILWLPVRSMFNHHSAKPRG